MIRISRLITRVPSIKNALRLAVSKDWISQPSKRPPMKMLPLGTSKPHRLLSVLTFPSAIRGGILLLSSAMHIIPEAAKFESNPKDTTIIPDRISKLYCSA